MPVCSRSARSQNRLVISGYTVVTVEINSLTGGLAHIMPTRRFCNLRTRARAKVTRARSGCLKP